jgi:hypothetical protein
LPPLVFLLRMSLFLFAMLADRGSGGFSGSAFSRRRCDSGQHFAKFFQAVALILPLVAKSLAHEDQVTFFSDSIAVPA